MKLEQLKKELPYKWRVQSCSEYGANCVAYIDSRDVQDLLDEVCGPANWSVLFEEHKGNLFAKIGIKFGEEFIWKSDCGTESNVEKQKGEASDAFKRAAVMWGVGRFLYSLKIHKIKEVKKDKNNRYYPVDSSGNKIWDITKHINNMGKAKPANKTTTPVKKAAPTTLVEPTDDLDISFALGDLNKALNLKELKEKWDKLDDDIKKNDKVIAKKDDMKKLLTPEAK